jgi:hypothetical protein
MKKTIFILILFNLLFGDNILINPSFEIWIDTLGVHLPFGWLTSEIVRESSAIKSTAAHTGRFACQLIGSDTVAFVTTMSIVRPSFRYNFSGFVKTNNLFPGAFYLQFLDFFLNPIGNPTVIPVYYSPQYRQYTARITAPESTFYITISLIILPGNNVLVDDVTLEETSSVAIKEDFYNEKRNFKITVYNNLGKKLGTFFSQNLKDYNFPSGVYFLKISDRKTIRIKKVVKF